MQSSSKASLLKDFVPELFASDSTKLIVVRKEASYSRPSFPISAQTSDKPSTDLLFPFFADGSNTSDPIFTSPSSKPHSWPTSAQNVAELSSLTGSISWYRAARVKTRRSTTVPSSAHKSAKRLAFHTP